MTKARSGPPPIVYILIVLGLLGGGYWLWSQKQIPGLSSLQQQSPPPGESLQPGGSNSANSGAFSLPTSVPPGTAVRIDGSTSMVGINQVLKRGFEGLFPKTTVVTDARGSDKGIQDLLANRVDIAAISRPLTAEEQNQGLVAIPIMEDAIAIIVGDANPFRKGLTSTQVVDIFQGKITNWSAVGGENKTIRVLNRPEVSGTHQAFRTLVLKDGNFGTTSNITTLSRDATTPLIRELRTDGISYATYAQVANQQTARTVAIDGLTPEATSYPYQRTLAYVYKQPPSPGVQAFLGYATSPQGQQAIAVGP